jgi:hypothetical protein
LEKTGEALIGMVGGNFVLGISCLNQGVRRGGKSGGWVDQREVYPPARKPQEFFSKLLVLISDSLCWSLEHYASGCDPGSGGQVARSSSIRIALFIGTKWSVNFVVNFVV